MSDEGIRAARELRTLQPKIGVVVLSQYAEPAYALALLEHGSGGRAYLLKERIADPAELVAAIVAVADGGSVIDPRVVEVLVNSRNAKPSPLDQLDDAGEGGARRDGAGQEQRGDRRCAVPVGSRGREAHQRAVLEARVCPRRSTSTAA